MLAKTVHSEQVWQSPDSKKTIWQVVLETGDHKTYALKTYSPKVSMLGFEGEVESYVNNRGDRFVRQTIKQKQTADNDRDNSIRAQWAIGQAIALASATMDKQKITMSIIERYARDLFATVSRVKGEELQPGDMKQAEAYIKGFTRTQNA